MKTKILVSILLFPCIVLATDYTGFPEFVLTIGSIFFGGIILTIIVGIFICRPPKLENVQYIGEHNLGEFKWRRFIGIILMSPLVSIIVIILFFYISSKV